MTNSLRGAVPFRSGGADYTLHYTFDALVALEDAFDLGIEEIGAMMGGARLKIMRKIFRIGLLEHQPDVTEQAAGEIWRLVEGEPPAFLLVKAFSAAFPDAGGEDAKGTEDPPPPAADGTGDASSAPGAN